MLAMSGDAAVAVGVSSVVFLILTFLIVLVVRSVPNKLLLLGFLMAITTVFLGALVPETGKLLLALLIPAIILILVGAICLAIGFAAKLLKTESKDQPPA